MTEIEKISINLGNVQKTLFLPLWGRAVESGKEHPELVDNAAVEIMKKVDYDFSTISTGKDDLSQIAWIRRSILMGFLSDMLKIQYIVHLQIAAK